MSDGLDPRALKYATQRVEDFALVNESRTGDEKTEATNRWLEHLGLDELLLEQLRDWIEQFVGPGWDGALMIGLAVGLLVAQYERENPTT